MDPNSPVTSNQSPTTSVRPMNEPHIPITEAEMNPNPSTNHQSPNSKSTLITLASLLVLACIVGITLYLYIQNRTTKLSSNTPGSQQNDTTQPQNNAQIEAIPTMTQEQQKETYGDVVCRRFTSIEEAIQVPEIACVLDLSEQNLTEVPEGVYGLTKLNEIDLSSNKLTSIPQKLIDMPNMVSINLSNNNISSVTEIKNKTAPIITDPEATPVPFTGLQSLDLSGNPISEADQQKLTELFGFSNPSISDSSVVKF